MIISYMKQKFTRHVECMQCTQERDCTVVDMFMAARDMISLTEKDY
jgi:hypothetical protein